jgi:phosphatidylglycerophosphate synthase
MYKQVPNALSISRIVFAALIILISAQLTVRTYLATLFLLITALLTDALDGRLARRWKVTSALGYVLDTMGDRAIQLALVLVFLVRYSFHPLFVWLLIFRDISIYAVRVLSKDWLEKSRRMRSISLFHYIALRVWIGMFIVRDGFRVFTQSDVLGTFAFEVAQLSILCVTICVSYYGLFRSFNWLIDRDHETL